MVALLVVVVALIVAAGVAALASVGDGGGSARAGRPVLLLALGAAVVLLVLVVGAGFALRGLGSGGNEHPAPSPVPVTRPAPSQASSATTLAQTRTGRAPSDLPTVFVQASEPRAPGAYPTVTALSIDAVVRVKATGFTRFERGTVRLCATELGRRTSCAGEFPVQFGEDGAADFQYRLQSASAPGGCYYNRATCAVEVTGAASGRRGAVQVVIGAGRRGTIAVTPRSGLRDGQSVSVSVAGFPANAGAAAMLCAPVGGYDVRYCGPTSATFVTGADGAGRTDLVVRAGRLGTDEVDCGPRHPCGVLVVTAQGFVAAPPARLQFSVGPGATYNSWRVGIGLTLAAALALVAVVLVLRTDWTKPTEAATPDIDAADLQTDQSLDDLFGTDAELDERDPIPF